jgi:opacity protein-like surface antigen
MNRSSFSLVSLALAAIVIAPTARAQNVSQAQTTDVGLAIGAALPRGDRMGALDMGGGPNTAFTIVGSIGLRPLDSPWSYRLEAQYTSFGLDEERRIEIGGDAPVIADGHVNVLNGTANVVLAVSAARHVRPYLIGGLGVYRLSSDIGYTTPEGRFSVNSAPSPSETKLGLNGGVGIELVVASLRTFVEARFHSVYAEGDKANLVPITFGMKF